ncbi:Hydroxyethylthiazole kinase [Trametes versicolor FP-101664 SS1]|uniref:Hydroxyethylthiazole kinase n=1 Tax=Trametes versicolor (strain FP-101664) TaxID=717944 RepID=UPI0004623AEC|nr:Hydroxyethylthiazole kinase [Trametes versicolor FP-101664 SS1]EIW63083.1 Hydroxyethylthiazole kinase [Trametes versicolor FP-101664 SS1]
MSATKPLAVDYSVYLVTGRELLPPGKDYLESLEESIKGGVTLVQIREKNADTGEFLRIAQASKAICHKYSVPILINDRIDIALAMGADGVHIGQTDMPVDVARRLLPANAIIGMTCNTLEHVRKAVQDGVDYVGLGPVWATQTKKVAHPVVGVRGLGELLDVLEGTEVKAVAIAGIKSTNALHLLHGSVTPAGRALDGVAVVSDIVASTDPLTAAKRIATIVQAFKAAPAPTFSLSSSYAADAFTKGVGELLSAVRSHSPLVHQITNNVVTTQSANATLALGASPIMATAPEEMSDLSSAAGALLVNFGTIQNLDGMLAAGYHYNQARKPVVFDPVGVGATAYRRTSAGALLNAWQPTVIKGNAAELGALANSTEVQARGVDSVGSGFADPAAFVRSLARKERAIVVLTGVTDYVSDGTTVVRLSNGHPLLGEITGSGCMVGTAVATFCAGASTAAAATRSGDEPEDAKLVRGDMLVAAVGGVLAVTIASELAGVRSDVKGSGTFLPAFIDELGALTPEKLAQYAKVEVI